MKKLQHKGFDLNKGENKRKKKELSPADQVISSPNRVIVILGDLSSEELQIY